MRIHMLLAAFLALVPLPALAQAPTGKLGGFALVNGAYQTASHDFTNGATFTENAEQASFNTDYTVKAGASLNLGGGLMLGRHLGAGVGISRFSVTTPGALTGSVPHPFFFNRARSVSGDVTGLKREELGVHIQLRGVLPIGSHLQVAAFGGPTFFTLKQGVVTTFQYSESYPYDSAAYKSATVTSGKASKVGFNAGGDVAYFFTRQIGVGGSVQMSSATLDLPGAGDKDVSVKAGGLQVGAGVRLRF